MVALIVGIIITVGVGCSAPIDIDTIRKEGCDAGYDDGFAAGKASIAVVATPTPFPKAIETITQDTASPATFLGHIDARSLNLRTEPNTESSIISEYEGGQSLTVLDEDGEWYKVSIGNSTGYMLKEYVKIDSEIKLTPAPTLAPISTPVPAQKPTATKKPAVSTNTKPFTNKYGSSTTKCAHTGCNNYIASSGDTNCCTTHSKRCGECNCYIDEDAMWCISCLTTAVNDVYTEKIMDELLTP